MTMTMTPRVNELSLLMRAAEVLLNAATDEASVLAQATELLGEQFGYTMRYLLLHDPERDELYAAAAAGEGSDAPGVRSYRMPTARGLTGVAARTRAIVNVGDVSADSRYIPVAPACNSEICVPLIARGDLLGVLTVQSPKTDAFSLQDERLLSAFAGLVSLALMHAREHASRRSDIAELQAVAEVARRAAQLDRDGTLQTIVEAFQRVTTADSTAVFLWDEDTQWLEVATMIYDASYYPTEYETTVRDTKVKLGEGIVGWTAEHREPVLISDAIADPRVRPVTGVSLDRKSAIVVPLVADQRLLGCHPRGEDGRERVHRGALPLRADPGEPGLPGDRGRRRARGRAPAVGHRRAHERVQRPALPRAAPRGDRARETRWAAALNCISSAP